MSICKQSSVSTGRIAPVLGVVMIGLLSCGSLVLAQQSGRVWVNVLAPDGTFKDRPFTASAICDGRVVFQQDGSLFAPPNKNSVGLTDLPLGLCDVRVECEGMVTEVKRGVQVFVQDRKVEIALQPGQGAHIVELAEGGLAREEVAARLRALEAGLENLKKEISSLASRPPH